MTTYAIDPQFDRWNDHGLALTFDDVRACTSLTHGSPDDVSLAGRVTRNITLKAPFIGAPMDTVTEWKMAVKLALRGALGVIHYNLPVDDQAAQVARGKHYLHGIIDKPISVAPDETVGEVLRRREAKGYTFHTFPVVDGEGRIVGLMTRNDFEMVRREPEKLIADVMTQDLILGHPEMTMGEAYAFMRKNKKKVLPLAGGTRRLAGMIVLSDAERILFGESDAYSVDARGSLLIAAAIGTHPEDIERATALVEKKVDLLVVDTAHADSPYAFNTIKELKKKFPYVDVLAGNVTEPDSALRLAQAGCDGIKVGQGGGSICTTRDVTGTGCPQITAVYNCARALRGKGVPVISDGGARSSGDTVLALAVGAEAVMYGSMFAGTDEAPGDVFEHAGRKVKIIRGMGSLEAQLERAGSRGRYQTSKIIVAEGIQGLVEYKGPVADVVDNLAARVRKGFWNIGAFSLAELHQNVRLRMITGNGLQEGHPHSVVTVPKLAQPHKADGGTRP